MMGRNLK